MSSSNPFQPPRELESDHSLVTSKSSAIRWALYGFACGASLPMAYGLYGIQRHYVYIASLAPGEATCGMGVLGSVAMIFVLGPICGMIGALVGKLCEWVVSLI